MGKFIDLTGRRSGRLEVVGYAGDKRWTCRCDCGAFPLSISGEHFRSGQSKSCGCLKADLLKERSRTHGLCGTTTYKTWAGMRSRAFGQELYKDVNVCHRWDSYENFLADMGEKPPGMSIDRIDPYGDYCPENCRWATNTVQSMNRRKAKRSKLAHMGVVFTKGSYRAKISHGGNHIILGYFKDEEMAGLAYETAKDRFMRIGFVKYFK